MGKLAENLSNNFIPGSSLLGKFVANLLLLDEQKESKGKMDTGGTYTYGDECLDLLDGKVRGLGQQDGNVARDVRARHRGAGRRRVPARAHHDVSRQRTMT